MIIDDCWIYWKEQCNYCQNRNKCPYKENFNNYIDTISKIDCGECYFSLNVKCDYMIFDKERYDSQSIKECYSE